MKIKQLKRVLEIVTEAGKEFNQYSGMKQNNLEEIAWLQDAIEAAKLDKAARMSAKRVVNIPKSPYTLGD